MSALAPPPKIRGPVPPEWLDRGVWLSKADEAFAIPLLIQQYREQAEAFTLLRDGQGPGVYRLTSRLTGKDRDQELLSRLTGEELRSFRLCISYRGLMEMDLKRQLDCGQLVAFGAKGAPDGEIVWIPPEAWFHLDVAPDERNVVRGEGMAYWMVSVVRLSDGAAGPAIAAPPNLPKPKTGPRPDKRTAVIRAMREKIAAGEITLEQLSLISKKELPAYFGPAGETTCFEARNIVLETPPNSD